MPFKLKNAHKKLQAPPPASTIQKPESALDSNKTTL